VFSALCAREFHDQYAPSHTADARATLLISQLAAAAANGALAGEETTAVSGDGVNAVATKADGSGAVQTNATTSFSFPAESVNPTATGGSGGSGGSGTCAEVRTVELTETALSRACRAAKAEAAASTSTAATTTTSSGLTAAEQKAADAGLNVPISSVVNADVYDCDGNVVPIANLTEPITFTLQIDGTFSRVLTRSNFSHVSLSLEDARTSKAVFVCQTTDLCSSHHIILCTLYLQHPRSARRRWC
jgi:hypothetical protein